MYDAVGAKEESCGLEAGRRNGVNANPLSHPHRRFSTDDLTAAGMYARNSAHLLVLTAGLRSCRSEHTFLGPRVSRAASHSAVSTRVRRLGSGMTGTIRAHRRVPLPAIW